MNRIVGPVAFALALLSPAVAPWAEEDITTTKLLETSVTNTGRPITYPDTDRPAITVAIVVALALVV